MDVQQIIDECQKCITNKMPMIINLRREFKGRDHIRFAGKFGGPLGYIHDIEGDWLVVEFDPLNLMVWILDHIE